MTKHILAEHLGLDEDDVRVVCSDVGGSFGIKEFHTYPDETSAAALSIMLKRPVSLSPTGWNCSSPTSMPATTG